MAMLTCQKCGRLLDEKNFYTHKDGTKTDMCKQCLTMHIDPFEPSSFEWLLERMDVPYLPGEWNILVEKQFAKDPNKVSPTAIFGKYLSKMKLKQWKKYGYADSAVILAKQSEEQAAREEQMKENVNNIEEIEQKYRDGQISEAQYLTLVSPGSMYMHNKNEVDMEALKEQSEAAAGPRVFSPYVAEDNIPDIAADLTQEDKTYLLMKWGRLYKPSQWVELERNYRQMEESFDIQDQDTRNSLILCCKTYLKMNEALDVGDVAGYKQLSQAYDQLRKSAKFTAVQNKEDKMNNIDAIGQAVLFCEKEGGKIARHDISLTYDKLDKVIDDMKKYNRSLIENDPAIVREIENYLHRREQAEQEERDRKEAEAKGLKYVPLSDEDLKEHAANLASLKRMDEEEE